MLRDESSSNAVASGEARLEIPPSRSGSIVKETFDYTAGSPVSLSTPFSDRYGSDSGSPSPMNRSYSLKCTGSNIASLRAAFEHADAASTPMRRFEKSPSRSFSERSQSLSNRYREKDTEIARLERQLADEIETRRSCQDQLKISQNRCEQLEKENKSFQLSKSQQSSQSHSPSNSTQNGSVEDGETKSIQRQLYELKRSISTATRIENQVSDSTFAQEFANLHHELQNFIVNTFRRTKVTKTTQELCDSLEKVAGPQQQEYLRPMFLAFEPSMKLAALQATAVCHIMEIFDEPLLFGLPDQQEWREDLRKIMKTIPAILAPSTFNKWRYLTLDAVRQSVGIEESVHLAASRLTEKICTTLGALTDLEDLAARASSLNAIVMRAVQLSHLFRVQRAQYEFALPAPGDSFQSDMMEDHSVDCEVSTVRTVACATFPSIIKHGDENGDDVQLSNIVVKAKVLCKG